MKKLAIVLFFCLMCLSCGQDKEDVPPDSQEVIRFRSRCLTDEPPHKDRLLILEYLVVPEDMEIDKSYEALCVMPADEWEDFCDKFTTGDHLYLEWEEEGKKVRRSLKTVFPWAACEIRPHGLMMGNNHDESGNTLLPPDGVPVEVLIIR